MPSKLAMSMDYKIHSHSLVHLELGEMPLSNR